MSERLSRRVIFERWPKGEAILEALHRNIVRANDIATIVNICSQPLIYNRLFRERLHDEPYTVANAESFIDFATQGWDRQTHFVYVIRNKENVIVGAVDIKSNNFSGAEIGYWLSESQAGYMTNAVLVLCEIAKEAGFKELYAHILPDNQHSADVVLRCGFKNRETVERNGRIFNKYIKLL